MKKYNVVLGHSEAYEDVEVEADRVTVYDNFAYFYVDGEPVFIVPSKHLYYIQEVTDE